MFAAELYATDGAEVIERNPEFGSNAQRAEVHSAVAADARRRVSLRLARENESAFSRLKFENAPRPKSWRTEYFRLFTLD